MLEDAHHFGARLGVEIAGGLISQDNARFVHQCAGDGHALLFTARQFIRAVADTIAQPHHLQGSGRALAAIPYASVDERQFDIGKRRCTGQEIEGLKDKADSAIADIGELPTIHTPYILTIKLVHTARGHIERPQDAHER